MPRAAAPSGFARGRGRVLCCVACLCVSVRVCVLPGSRIINAFQGV